jgi:chemotaxis protein MotA
MLVLIGIIVVIVSTLGGFMLAGGHPAVLLHVSEFVVIFGIAIGILTIASPGRVLHDVISKTRLAFSSKKPGKEEYFALLKLLYEIFMVGRRNGLIALEEHVMEPERSAIFQRYPVVTAHHERLEFICNGLRPVIDGKIKPDQLEDLMTTEFDAKADEADHPVHVLQMVGDSLPGIGIVAAVLGIINTMSAIADGPSVVGERVAAALTGTLLGVFSAYGLVNPMATRIKFNNAHDQQYLRCILAAVSSFAKGLAPITAVEVARRSLDSGVQPTAEELETAVKGLNVTAK